MGWGGGTDIAITMAHDLRGMKDLTEEQRENILSCLVETLCDQDWDQTSDALEEDPALDKALGFYGDEEDEDDES